MKESPIIGIDLGTTNSAVAVVDTGFPVIIPDVDGGRLLPSVAHFPAGGEPVVGFPARRARRAYPRCTISSVKRFMGRSMASLSEEECQSPFAVKSGQGGEILLPQEGREWTPVEVSALYLKKLKQTASNYLGQEVLRAVITVPAYFNDAQRQATKQAGEAAGLKVERILNEPTAAALAYGVDRRKRQGRYAVYDLGGGTFDLSILEFNEGVFQVLATHGNTRLGGDDIDARVAGYISRQVQERIDAPLGELDLARIREEAERVKITLSTVDTVEIQLPFLEGGTSFDAVLTRDQLEELAWPVVESTRRHCLQALHDARLEISDLDGVLLVGGQTRMPLVRKLVAEWFGKEPDCSINPDEAVALGASIQAGILDGTVQETVLLDVTPLSLGIETFGGLMNVLIPRNSSIPTKAGELFTTAVDGQKSMKIHVLQGERELARDNFSLGSFEIDFESAPRGVPRVGVQFELDADGILNLLIRDTGSGKERKARLESAVDVTDETVEKMVAESVEHAFEDMEERRLVELRLKAEKMTAAARQGLELCGAELPPAEQDSIRKALGVLDSLAKGEGGRRELESAMQELDKATQGLARLIMDKAAEAALRKKGLI